jgi:hypothetical protein
MEEFRGLEAGVIAAEAFIYFKLMIKEHFCKIIFSYWHECYWI